MTDEARQSFVEVKDRLDEIVEAVSDDDISLDAALDLYEEAIKLGMKVSAVLEEDISEEQIAEEVVTLQASEGIALSEEEVSSESLSDQSNETVVQPEQHQDEPVAEGNIEEASGEEGAHE